jgi:hypothetical protein
MENSSLQQEDRHTYHGKQRGYYTSSDTLVHQSDDVAVTK